MFRGRNVSQGRGYGKGLGKQRPLLLQLNPEGDLRAGCGHVKTRRNDALFYLYLLKKEDEENVAYILEKYPSMELVPIDKEQFKGLSDGFGYPQTARLFPHRIQGEGHFLALFHKKEDENGSGSGAAVLRLSGDEKRLQRAKEAGKQEDLMKFLKNCRKEWDLGCIYIRDEQVYYLPEGLKTGLPLRFLRTGLHLGELKKGRFEPSQAFAMALKRRISGTP